MTASTLLAELLWPLFVFGAPVAVFTGIGRASRPARERTPLTRWGWRDLYSNFRRGLRISSENTLLGRLISDDCAPMTQGPTEPPRSATH
ncbi:hypothetical protein [Kocuria nitroreducens]|uniref:hypothetical protein n=1 Tax=Kocuria nitroreducens TaxID=3058914 RepID=UPI0036DC2867